jgi:hypothetical protein
MSRCCRAPGCPDAASVELDVTGCCHSGRPLHYCARHAARVLGNGAHCSLHGKVLTVTASYRDYRRAYLEAAHMPGKDPVAERETDLRLREKMVAAYDPDVDDLDDIVAEPWPGEDVAIPRQMTLGRYFLTAMAGPVIGCGLLGAIYGIGELVDLIVHLLR